MLKFFFKYNKYILAVGVTFLMITFLIQPTLSMFRPDPSEAPVGTIGGEEVTLGEQRAASVELQVLQAVSPLLAQMSLADPTQWMLVVRDARAMGLSASQAEVEGLLLSLEIDDAKVAQIARRMGTSVDLVQKAVAHWIVAQQYHELVSGLGHLPLVADVNTPSRVGHVLRGARLLQAGYVSDALLELESARGVPRVSEPLAKHFLQDRLARVRVVAVGVDSGRYHDRAGQPSREAINDLFNRFKERLPGEGEPYGFGYRVPERVKIEYLTIPYARVRERVTVEEADALRYYDDHAEEFKVSSPPTADGSAAGDAVVRPYAEVRDQIVNRLKDAKATEQIDRMAKTAQAVLLDDARHLDESGGYRQIPLGWEPMPLSAVAEHLQRLFGVLPDVTRRDDRWLTRQELAELAGIGSAGVVAGRTMAPFDQYVFSCRELLGDGGGHPLASLRLQAKLPGATVQSADGTRYIFRLIDAEPGRVPSTVEEVIEQVTRDAARLAAYEVLQAEAQAWLERARGESLQRLSEELGSPLVSPEPFAKWQVSPGGSLEVPVLPEIGQDERLIGAVFELVGRLNAAGGVSQASEADRTVAVPVDRKQALYLVRVEEFQPMTVEQYRRVVEKSQSATWILQALQTGDRGDRPRNPLSMEELSARVGYKPLHEADEGRDEDSSVKGGERGGDVARVGS
jgi:hypothetical protein